MKNNKLTITTLILAMIFSIFMPVFAGHAVASEDIISNVKVKNQKSGVQITWQTSEKVTTKLSYGLADPFGGVYKTEIIDTNALTSHSADLRALTDNRDYIYKIEVYDPKSGDLLDTHASRFDINNTYEENIRQHKYFFMLTFNNFWESTKKNQPSQMINQDGLSFDSAGFSGTAFRVNRKGSHLEYDAKEDELSTSYRGALEMWVSFDNFDKDAILWQSKDNGYTIKFEDLGISDRLVVSMDDGSRDTNYEITYPISQYSIDASKRWCTGEWHYIAMIWSGYESGTVKLFIDGDKVGESKYNNTDPMTTFRIGSGYDNDNEYFSNGKIDEFKIHRWLMSEKNIKDTYYAYNFSDQFEKKGVCHVASTSGRVAGAQMRDFKFGKLLKTPDNKIYVVIRDEKKLHIENVSALARYGTHPVVSVSYDEANQYKTVGTFTDKTYFPDGTLLKGSDNSIYWLWDGEKRPIANEYVFNKYGNDWADVITLSDSELAKYPTGFTYYN